MELREELKRYRKELDKETQRTCIESTFTLDTGISFNKINMADSSLIRLLDSSISPVQKYFLWAAATNSGLYSNKGPIPNEISLLSPMDQQRVYSIQRAVVDQFNRIRQNINDLTELKEKLITEVHNLDKIMQRELYGKMATKTIKIFNNTIEQV